MGVTPDRFILVAFVVVAAAYLAWLVTAYVAG